MAAKRPRHSNDSYRRQSESLRGSQFNRDRRKLFEDVIKRCNNKCEKCGKTPLRKLIKLKKYKDPHLDYSVSNMFGLCQLCYLKWLKGGKPPLEEQNMANYKLEEKLRKERDRERESDNDFFPIYFDRYS